MIGADGELSIELGTDELRAVAAFSVTCADTALSLFERDRADDPRPRAALVEARRFAAGGGRTRAMRVTALDAHRAATAADGVGRAAAAHAARSAGSAAAAGYLHPLAKATQVLHILGSAAYTARALELDAGGEPAVGAAYIEAARGLAGPVLVAVLMRYPDAPAGRGRVGELVRELDASLRRTPVPGVGNDR